MGRRSKYPAEVRERAVRLVLEQQGHHESQWAAIAVEFATLEWVDWFNNRRILGPLGYVPPAEYEAAFYSSTSTPAAVAGLM